MRILRSLWVNGVSSCGEHPVIGDGRLDTTIGLAKIPQQGQCVSSGTTREQGQLIQGGSREKLRTWNYSPWAFSVGGSSSSVHPACSPESADLCACPVFVYGPDASTGHFQSGWMVCLVSVSFPAPEVAAWSQKDDTEPCLCSDDPNAIFNAAYWSDSLSIPLII